MLPRGWIDTEFVKGHRSLIVLAVGMAVAGAPLVAGPRTADAVLGGIVIQANKSLNVTASDGQLVTGTVKNAQGAVVAGATVQAIDANETSSVTVFTGADGTFQLPVRPGTHRIVVHPPLPATVDPSKYDRSVATSLAGVSVTGDTAVGDITLREGVIYCGSFVPPSGQLGYLAGSLAAKQTNGDRFMTQAATIIRTQFGMAVPKGKSTIVFSGGQAFSTSSAAWQLLNASGFTSFQVNLSRDLIRNIKIPIGYKLFGNIRDSKQRRLDLVIFITPRILPLAGGTASGQIGMAFVMNGKYTTYLPAGEYDLNLVPIMERSYGGAATVTQVQLTMPAADKSLDMTLPDGLILTGRVRDAAGVALPNAFVQLRDLGAPESTPPISTRADSRGIYRVAVPAGTYNLHAVPSPTTVAAGPPNLLPVPFGPR